MNLFYIILDFVKKYFSEPKNYFLFSLAILTFYRYIFILIGLFSKKTVYPETNKINKYGIVIAARNEELVIGNLLDSLWKQNYDLSKLTIFVVADNCTDNTANIAREHNAVVYERFDETKKRKGWALEFLFEQIERDYGITSFDGFIFFDADNLVDNNFVKEINNAFVDRGGIIAGYRNVKNFDTNLVSSAYGVHFYQSIVSYHRPRTKLNLGTHLAGTGYVVDSNLLKDGWTYHTLTEDSELTVKMSSKGVKIYFCEDAIFYDEQPTSFKVAFRQRKRWTRGRLDVFALNFHKLAWNGLKRVSFTLYDLFIYNFPWPFYSVGKFIFLPIIAAIIAGNVHTGSFWLHFLGAFGMMLLGVFLYNLVFGAITIYRERKNIPASRGKKILAVFTYPWFNMISIFLALSIIISPKVVWKQIVHDDERSIDDVNLED